MKRNDFLDVLKGICILLVILTHFDWVEAERLRYFFPYWMNPAVPVFMIISGYVYTESFKRRSITTFKQAYALKGLLDKIIRYTVPLIIIYIIEIPLKQLIYQKSLTLNQIIKQLIIGGWGPGSYYFPYMIQFIFLFPLIFFIIKKWDFTGLLFCGFMNIFYEIIKIPLHIPKASFRLIVLRYIFAIALGCYFSIGKFKIKKWMGYLSLIFGAVFLYIVCYGGYKPQIFFRWSRTSMPAVFYIAPIAYLLITKCSWQNKSLAKLGKASYNIFLTQMVYFHMANQIFDGVEGSIPGMLVTYTICILLGLIFYKIETPITKRILTWNTKLFERRIIYEAK